jgi:hypothetical protein
MNRTAHPGEVRTPRRIDRWVVAHLVVFGTVATVLAGLKVWFDVATNQPWWYVPWDAAFIIGFFFALPWTTARGRIRRWERAAAPPSEASE